MTSRKKRRKRRQRLTGLAILVVLLILCTVIGIIAINKKAPDEVDYTAIMNAVTPAPETTAEPVPQTEEPAATEEPASEPEMQAEETVIPEETAVPEPAAEATAEPETAVGEPVTEAPVPEEESVPAEEPATAEPAPTEEPEKTLRTFTMSAAGDCTLGGDINGQSYKRFHNKIAEKGYDWCFKKVAPVFEADDITFVNLEVALTTATKGRKSNSGVEFWMRGKPENAKLLENCGIDVCNLSNNHTIDFMDQGLQDTKDNLASIDMPYCDYDEFYVTDVNGISVGFLGFSEWYISVDKMVDIIREYRPQCEVLVVGLHAGSELKYEATANQQKYAHAIIDAGGDVVVGSHSHVIGGIEKYKGKYIAYSLGNFCFGGKANPADHDTFIFQVTFTVDENGEIVENTFNIVPCYISSAKDTNNYQPVPVTDEKEIARITKKIKKYSKNSDN